MSNRPSYTIRSAALACSILLLSGCGSGRAGELEEKLQRAEQAAKRAEAAQKAAETAAQKAAAFGGRSSAPAENPDPPPSVERDMDRSAQDSNSAFNDDSAEQPEG